MPRRGPTERPVERLVAEAGRALRRRGAHEARLAGALRALGRREAAVRDALAAAASTLGRRGEVERPLFEAAVRTLSECGDERASKVLRAGLSSDEGLGSLAAACFCREGALDGPLARLSASRQAHVAFAAEVARVARGEARGGALSALAPRLKEASRIALCAEVLLPLRRAGAAVAAAAPALGVLREAERHLGRWLLLGQVGARSGDEEPRRQAQERSEQGPPGGRLAWSLVAWALSFSAEAPSQRPTLDVVARLSDRPTTERELSFLFGLAKAGALQIKPLLEGLVTDQAPGDEGAVRAAFYLARDHQRDDLRLLLRRVPRARREGLWGPAAAALHDLGDREGAAELAQQCAEASALGAAAWGALVLSSLDAPEGPLLTEENMRWLCAGWLP